MTLPHLPAAVFAPTREYTKHVQGAWDAFLGGESDADSPEVRFEVRESWRRSQVGGVNPDLSLPPIDLDEDALRAYRAAHPLSRVIGVIEELLGESAVEAGHLLAVTDAQARLLWIDGDRSLRSRAEAMNFVEGACWSELLAGTNAPGLALDLRRPMQVYASEHFSRNVHPWSCTAAPIIHPVSGELLGAIDLTGADHVASPQALALVRATVAAVRRELHLQTLHSTAPRPPGTVTRGLRVAVLGKNHAELTINGSRVELSARHSELLLLLTENREGMFLDQLAVELHEHEANPVTIRAEISRLRKIVGDHVLLSQPYRLAAPTASDAEVVLGLLRRGALKRALALYPGPVLPRSQAPGVIRLREELEHTLRHAVVRSANPDLILTLLSNAGHRDEHSLWHALLSALPLSSPRRAFAEANLHRCAK